MNQTVTIAPAKNDDRETVIGLLAAQLEEHQIGTPRSRIGVAVDGMLADATRGFILVAQYDARSVGVAYVSFTWSLEHGGKSSWLEELYVVPEYREKGIGTVLLAAVLSRADGARCAAVDLEVDAEHTRAAHLYARTDFLPLPRARWVRALTLSGSV